MPTLWSRVAAKPHSTYRRLKPSSSAPSKSASSKYPPASSTITSLPAAESTAAATPPPAPDPITHTSHLRVLSFSGVVTCSFRGASGRCTPIGPGYPICFHTASAAPARPGSITYKKPTAFLSAWNAARRGVMLLSAHSSSIRHFSSAASSENRINVPDAKNECRRESQKSSRFRNSQQSISRGLKSRAAASASGTPRSTAEGQPGADGKKASQIAQSAWCCRSVSSIETLRAPSLTACPGFRRPRGSCCKLLRALAENSGLTLVRRWHMKRIVLLLTFPAVAVSLCAQEKNPEAPKPAP